MFVNSSWSRFAAISEFKDVMPVALPPGWLDGSF